MFYYLNILITSNAQVLFFFPKQKASKQSSEGGSPFHFAAMESFYIRIFKSSEKKNQNPNYPESQLNKFH